MLCLLVDFREGRGRGEATSMPMHFTLHETQPDLRKGVTKDYLPYQQRITIPGGAILRRYNGALLAPALFHFFHLHTPLSLSQVAVRLHIRSASIIHSGSRQKHELLADG